MKFRSFEKFKVTKFRPSTQVCVLPRICCSGVGLVILVYPSRVCARKSGDGHDYSANTHCHVQLGKQRYSDIIIGENHSSCQVRQSVPRVSYISFLDIWMLFCMIFVFSCILEFIITTIFIRAGRKGDADRVSKVLKMIRQQSW